VLFCSGINNTPFHKHQQDETLQQYISPVLGLLAMLLRPKKAYQLTTTHGLDKALSKLVEQLPSGETNKTAFCIQDILVALWTVKWQPVTSIQRMTDPTLCYIALSMLEQDGSFADTKHVTGYASKFVHCLRLVFLVQMRRIMLNNPDMDIEAASQTLRIWYIEKQESTFNSLRSLSHRATAVAKGSMSLPRIWWTDRVAYQSMLYMGSPLHLADIRKVFPAMEESTIDLWKNKVMLGLPLRVSYGNLLDDLTNTSVGYSFLKDP
jgi:hypothetical protein